VSAIIERVSKQLYRLGSELSSVGIEEAKEIEAVARELESVEGVLVTPAVARMVEEMASALSRFSPGEGLGLKELASELRELARKWIPRCVKASLTLKLLVLIYSLSLITLSVVSAIFLSPSSIPSDVATLFTIFVCSVAIFGILLGMNMMLILLPALPVAPLAQCASIAPTNHAIAWACIGVAASLAASGFVALISVRSYRRALLALLNLSSSIDLVIEKAKEAREKLPPPTAPVSSEQPPQPTPSPQPASVERAEGGEELPPDVYGAEASELARYSEEMKRLR